MIQEHKELLIKDLCARLPYRVVVDYAHNAFDVHKGHYVKQGSKCILTCYLLNAFISPRQNENGEYIKPYLFPLSSMTEEQKEELYKIGWYLDEDTIYSCFRNYDDVNYKTHTDCFELIDWCYKNHIDINGLIKKGLAIDATGKNIY